MAISSKEKDTAVAPKETAMDPIETKEALPRKAEVLESLIRDNSKSKNGLFVKNRKEESYNDSTENEGEDLILDLPQRGEGQRKSRLNHAPLRTYMYMYMYLTKWKPRHLFCLLYIGLFLISGVAGHGERDDPDNPIVLPTSWRTVPQGARYMVTELPEGSQYFRFHVLTGGNLECTVDSFSKFSACVIASDNHTACNLTVDHSTGTHRLLYLVVDITFPYCIFQHAVNNFTLLSGTVFIIPNKTSGNEESLTVNPITEATTCKPAASCNNYGWYAFGALLAVGLLALAFFIGQQIRKNREKSIGTEVGRPQQREEEKKLNAPVPVSVQIQSPTDS